MSNFPKVTADMLRTQLHSTLGFLGVMLAIQIIRIIFGGSDVDGYYMSILIAANIYMFIIGMTFSTSLPHYVQNGVTRKDFFNGTLLASIGMAVFIPVMTLALSLLERFIMGNIANIQLGDSDINTALNAFEASGHVIGDIIGSIVSHTVQAFILTPYVDPASNWFLAIGVFSLNIFMFYLLGWLISASFSRLGVGAGLAFIALAIMISILGDTLQRVSLDLPVLNTFTMVESLPLGVTIPGLLLVILIPIWLIRLLTKRTPIKM
ncbi:hypothetical protein HUG15_17005 [Salicibibacter cibarius]|uniref:Uncharacterized protein n=1 Tax=Salicibibacter cibarius TaxID=2743000 RepID=A0A7T6Z5C2_9BACI|nr:hypothetical protein [Salicibibacter cibarius]QQK77107.1 hypothetical protein HUG15_17005 [Salicibibacter cibarius]